TATQACQAVSDTLTLTITDAPVADAGSDLVRCKNNPDATLNGDVYGGSSTGVWSTYNGSGTFSPDSTALNATYSPSSSDTAQGYVNLVLTTTNNQSNCLPDTDTMQITYTEQPNADAGPDQTVCADHDVDLNGSVDGGSGEGQWSTPNGTGSFLPSDTALQGSYSFSAADTANGSVTLVLSSINNGNCNADTDTMEVSITPAPSADAGNDTSLCANNDTLQLNGNVSVASGGEWSTSGDGTFLPHDSTLTASYAPGPADDDSGSVTLILSTTGNGNCYAHHDSLELTLDSAPQVDAGSPIYICEGDTTADLNGSVSGATSTGVWSSSGTGSFDPSNTALSGTYQMSDADTAAGSVWLTLTSTNNGNCYAESDSVEVTVTTAATVTAGSDTSLCKDALDSLALSGSVSGGSGEGEWSSDGFGNFSPSDTVDDPSYVFDPQDTSMSQLHFAFASVASCVNDTDSVTVDLIDAPIVEAGPDMGICEGQQADLNGTVIDAAGGVWSSSGSGSFIPDDSTLSADYLPDSSDVDSGTLSLYLTSYGGNAAQCGTAHDTLQLNIGAKPVAAFGMDPACVGEDLGLSDSSFVANDSLVSHQWVIGTDTLNGPAPSYSIGDTGTYTVKLTVTSSSGCQDTIARSVSVDPQPIAAFFKERRCHQEVQFLDSSSVSSGSIVGYNWTFGDGDSSNMEDPLHAYADTGTYGVTLTVTTDSGCTASSGDSVDILPDPIADYEPRGGSFDPGETIGFEAFPKGAISYLWDFDDGNSSIDSMPEHFFDEKGSYEVSLIVEDSLGCLDTVTYTFSIGEDASKPVAVPTAFTPNGDGENDVLRVLGGPMKKMDFRIYNEWGNELFVSKKQSNGWDGTVNGNIQPAGSYVFILKGVTVSGKEIEKRGKVHLIR
ncbi:MAG: PKD domain-containing protein, partial [Flavobacteriales bacterium]